MIYFKEAVNKEDIREISKLARKIFEEYFTPMIGFEQVDYMLKKFQSEEALSKQIRDGCKYFMVLEDNKLAGYFAIKPEENRLFLSKFYLDKEYRGLGIARKMMEEIIKFSQSQTLPAIYLTVNKKNERTINIYKKFGFEIIKSVETDIGQGFFMDDYIMEKKLS